MKTTISGSLLEERIITDNCRKIKPTDQIIFEVLYSVKEKVRSVLTGWPKGSGVKIHIVVTVERPRIKK